MKKLIMSVILFTTLPLWAQHKMQVWQEGTSVEYSTTSIDSITFLSATPLPTPPQRYQHGVLPTVFKVSDSTYIQFSQGNLQYNAGNGRIHVCADYSLQQGTWRFAPNQYDYIGEGNLLMAKDYNGWTDLFGWGTSGWNSGAICYEPWSVSPEGTEYAPNRDSANPLAQQYAFADWGVYNAIYNGGDKPHIWRTLSAEEWKYLLTHCRWTMARIQVNEDTGNTILGLMLLPMNFVCPATLSVTEISTENQTSFEWDFATDSYIGNVYTEAQFALLEDAGAVFLPCAGSRWETRTINTLGTSGLYWSSSVSGIPSAAAVAATLVLFSGTSVHAADGGYRRSFGRSVRLVRDTVGYVPDTTIQPDVHTDAFSVSADKQVRFSQGNLQYTQSTDTWSFAEHQYDMIGDANIIAQEGYGNNILADKIDLFGWSGSTGSAKWGVSNSTDVADYGGEFMDWGLNIGDGNTWYTLSREEWNYLCNIRTDADKLMGVARINLNADGSEYANGIILLPDNWVCPTGMVFKPGFRGDYTTCQTFTLPNWQELEAAGAIFLPATGCRLGNNVLYVQEGGYYWSATPNESSGADDFRFWSNTTNCSSVGRDLGQAVRLVQDVK